jgi:hypothetical protein
VNSVRVLVLVLVAAISGPSEGSDEKTAAAAAAEEFRRIAAAHRDLHSYDLQIEALVESSGSSLPLRATVKCDEQRRCLRVFQKSTTLETPRLSLMLDATSQTITVTRHKVLNVPEPQASMDPSKALETWLENGGKLSGGESTPMGRHWTLETGKPTSPRAQMYVDPDSRLLRRFVYQNERSDGIRTTVDIRYTWGDAARLDPREFETSQFIEEQGRTIRPAEAYARYRIISTDGP